MKLISSTDKYITLTDENTKAKYKQTGLKQNISYNVQGELINNKKCLNKQGDNKVKFTDCDSKSTQWNIDPYGHITDKENVEEEKCLTENSDNELTIEPCTENSSQVWTVENSDDVTTNYSWDEYQGKTVVLVESSNPWFINKDTAHILEDKSYNVQTPVEPVSVYFERPVKHKEGFTTKNINYDNAMFCILLMLCLVVLWRMTHHK